MYKRRVGIKAVLAGLALALGCVTGAWAQAPVKVKLLGTSATVEAYHGFMYLGVPLGFYKQNGVDVEFNTIAGSGVGVQLVGTNVAQMAYVGIEPFLLAKAKHPSLPVIAVYLHDRGNIYEIAIPEDSPIKTVADLKDKKIGVANLSSGSIPLIKGMLTEAGLNANSVELIPVGNGAQAAMALSNGRVQVLSLFRAQHALLETLGLKFRYLTKNQPSAVIVVNTNFFKQNPDAVAAVLKGIAMGSTFAQANPNAAVREHWKMWGKPAGLSEQEAMARGSHVLVGSAKMWKDYRDTSVKWGEMNKAQWDGMQKFMIDQKLIEAALPSETLFTNELIDKVNQIDTEKVAKAAKAL